MSTNKKEETSEDLLLLLHTRLREPVITPNPTLPSVVPSPSSPPLSSPASKLISVNSKILNTFFYRRAAKAEDDVEEGKYYFL